MKDGLGKVKEYRRHREAREKQVVEALKGVEGGRTVTASECVLFVPFSSCALFLLLFLLF